MPRNKVLDVYELPNRKEDVMVAFLDKLRNEADVIY